MAVLQFTAEWDVNPADRGIDRIGSTARSRPRDPRTPRTLRALRTRAHSRFGRLTSKPGDSTNAHSGAGAKRTNERRTNEVWLDATTDSVGDYTAVDDGGVTDREHLASESLDGCDE
ncbi:hypothetical protein PR003_g11449 [Phytophthora rubi]|uniref:Uncharacterized protein n=1 Tax=Phytophthora rubi TaxID=129364 RepID=A0A6A4FG87_9STRA|nr:hypothetical protein PR003_g11449 [Phytophthora rubi]